MHPAQDTSAWLILLESSESQLYRGVSHFLRRKFGEKWKLPYGENFWSILTSGTQYWISLHQVYVRWNAWGFLGSVGVGEETFQRISKDLWEISGTKYFRDEWMVTLGKITVFLLNGAQNIFCPSEKCFDRTLFTDRAISSLRKAISSPDSFSRWYCRIVG